MIRRRSDLPLSRDSMDRFLPWLIAFMVFLAILAMAGMLALNAAAQRWDTGDRATVTVQIPPAATAREDERRLKQVLSLLAARPGVARYEALSRDRLMALLRPWIGDAGTARELPLPMLVDVIVDGGGGLDLAALSRDLAARVPGVSVDDHRVWLQRLIRLVTMVEAVAWAILGFIALATVGTVVFTTRTGLAIHREAIEVLHMIGAQDSYIARQFASRALGLGLKGGLLGLLLAAPTLGAIVYLARRTGGNLLPEISLGAMHWAGLLLLPLAVSALAMITARVTVMRNLKRMI